MGAAKEIVKKYLTKKAEQEAAKASERAALKASATPEQLAKLVKEDAHMAAEKASELRLKNYDNPEEEQAALQKWIEARARSNEILAKEANENRNKIKVITETEEQVPRFKAPEPTAAQLERVEKQRRADALAAKYEAELGAEKNARKYDPKAVAASEEKTNVAAFMPAMGLSATGFTNPTEVVKAAYEKFNKVRQSVVDKIVDLTGAHVTHNPHVPQYAKETYTKAADALVSNATDPLNYVGGAGAADAALGAASAGYDIYAGRPKVISVDKNPVTNPTQVINWKPK